MAKADRGGRRASRSPGARSLIVLGLIGFFVMATGVIARRTLGINQAKTLRALETRRDAVEASRVRLEVEIRDASSRARLGPVVERNLRMYVPADSQIIILKREPLNSPDRRNEP